MTGTVLARLPGSRVLVKTATGDVRAEARGVTSPPLGLTVTVEQIGGTWYVVSQGAR